MATFWVQHCIMRLLMSVMYLRLHLVGGMKVGQQLIRFITSCIHI
jgi:hypothetical protein